MKKANYICIVLTMLIVLTTCMGCSEEKKYTDIEVDGDKITLAVNRKFNMYKENPAEVQDAKPKKEVKVVMEGNGNIASGEFDGNVSVEGLELGGNIQSYIFNKEENGYYLGGIGGNMNDVEPAEGKTYNYFINIAEDLQDIEIWVVGTNGEEDEWYWVLDEDV